MRHFLDSVLNFFLKLARPDSRVQRHRYTETCHEPCKLVGGPADGKELIVSLRTGDTLYIPVVAPLPLRPMSEAYESYILTTNAAYHIVRRANTREEWLEGWYVETA